jgi:hypothetical protein
MSNAPAVSKTTRYISVPKSGALDFFKGNATKEMAKGMNQLRSPSNTARFQRTIVASNGQV